MLRTEAEIILELEKVEADLISIILIILSDAIDKPDVEAAFSHATTSRQLLTQELNNITRRFN